MKDRKAQSLLELAIFGVILISLLGTLITYGLRSKYQQQIMQQGFRKALAATTKTNSAGQYKGQANYVYIRDRHTPDPSDPFGMGSVAPYSYSGQVIRDFRLNETALDDEDLPGITINIPNVRNGVIQDQPVEYKTAGFADYCLPETCGDRKVEKLEEIFGYSNVWEDETISCPSGEIGYKVIDPCEGEIMSYDGCKKQCAMITNENNACVEECKLAKLDPSSSEARCIEICSEVIEIPWYCGEIETIFNYFASYNKPKQMGLQPDYEQTTDRDNLLQKTETEIGIHTTDTFNWSDATRRTIILIRNRALTEESVTGTISHEDEQVNWETVWP